MGMHTKEHILIASNRRQFMITCSIAGAFLFLGLSTACSSRLDVQLLADGSAKSSVDATLDEHFMRVLANLSASGQELALDASAINEALIKAPGMARAALSSPNANRISGSVDAGDVSALFTPQAKDASSMALQALKLSWLGAAGAKTRPGTLTIHIDRHNAPEFVANLSPDIVDYLTALMAPLATGEELTLADYLDSVTALYGPGVAEEIRKGSLSLSLTVPGSITAASTGTWKGKRLDWEIPLAAILVLEQPLTLSLSWK